MSPKKKKKLDKAVLLDVDDQWFFREKKYSKKVNFNIIKNINWGDQDDPILEELEREFEDE